MSSSRANESIDPAAREALEELALLPRFTGTPAEFWPRYLAALAKLTSADHTALFLLAPSEGEGQPPSWRKLTEIRRSSRAPLPSLARILERRISAVADRCDAQTGGIVPFRELADGEDLRIDVGEFAAVAIRPRLFQSGESCLVAAITDGGAGTSIPETLMRLELAAETPASFQSNAAVRQAGTDVQKLATALDVSVQIDKETHFLACALAFCNGIAAQLQCDRVSLGWQHRGYVRLEAMSRTEKFDRKMEAAQLLEAAMDECYDQDDEIFLPPADDATTVARDHERFAASQKVQNLVSVPLRTGDEPVGVVLCERGARPFDPVEARQLRLTADVAARRLADLRERGRWFGARAASSFRKKASGLLGPHHTWLKLLALFLSALLAVLVFVRVPYRAEAGFILRSDEVRYVAAPFPGFIADVHVRAGDRVAAGDPVLGLDRVELELERSSAQADLVRYRREAEKARAAGELSQMRIAQALADQANARLERVDHRLGQTTLTAPFDAFVVEGDQRERYGAPVEQGEILFKLARLDSLYVEAEVDERDVHEIIGRDKGEIAFVSQPDRKYPVRIVRVVPAAIPGDEGNVFLVRCEFEETAADWWKPGMSGLCKLSVDSRPLIWILTHRTVDFLRLFLWW